MNTLWGKSPKMASESNRNRSLCPPQTVMYLRFLTRCFMLKLCCLYTSSSMISGPDATPLPYQRSSL
jgi:hypothetical protein